MLSANAIGDVNAHHRIRHRARHGLRGGVASPLQRFAPVVPRRRPRRPRMSRAGQARHVSCQYPALSRLPCGTCTAPDVRGRLGASTFFHRLFQAHPTGRQASRPQRDSSNGLPVLFPSTTTPAPSGRSRTGSTSSAAPLRLRRKHTGLLHPHTRFLNIHTRASRGYFRRLIHVRRCTQILRFRLRVFWYCYR